MTIFSSSWQRLIKDANSDLTSMNQAHYIIKCGSLGCYSCVMGLLTPVLQGDTGITHVSQAFAENIVSRHG